MNRKFHTLTGHYNIYFNGEQKLLDAIRQLEASHRDDFTKVLSVYPLGTAESAKSTGNVLDEAIKKFSGTIQMHTIGSYTDDSYYLLGQCRYYKQDYFAAIETYQYIIGKYKESEYKNLSTCWIARCYVGLDKMGEAEALMGLLLANKNFNKKEIALIYATAADINIKLEKTGSAIENLNKALTGQLTKDQKIRYNYILGQLCLQANKKPEATYHFNRVLKYIPTYDFAFNANISLTQIYEINDKRSVARVRKSLKKMADDDKNIDYRDQIYFELGKLELLQKNYPQAVKNFQSSVALSTKNRNQKALSYYELAKLYFYQKDFKPAQAYYDTTVQTLDPKDKNFESINQTKIVLSELINNLLVYETEDSLQKLSNLSKNALERKIDSWITEEAKKNAIDAKLAKKKAKEVANIKNNENQNFVPSPNLGLPGAGSTAWYFYNSTLMTNGVSEFSNVKKWGQRPNEDYWRIAAKEKPKEIISEVANSSETDTTSKQPDAAKNELVPEQSTVTLTGNPQKDKWIKNVPFTKAQKQNSNSKMLESLHNLGLIYYNRLKNYTESIKYFEMMEKKYPVNEYEPDAYYYEYKSYTDLKQTEKATSYKSQLIKEYPAHPYSLLLQNITIKSAENDNNKALVSMYESMYDAYKNNNCLQAMLIKSDLDKTFPGNNFRPKYELLNAFCIGKTQNKDAFKKALIEVSNNFKGTDVAKTANDYLAVFAQQEKKESIIGKDSTLNELNFDIETETSFYYVFAIKNDKADFTEYVSKISTYNESFASENHLKVNANLSNEGYQVLLIREFANFKIAQDYLNGLKANDFVTKQLKVTDPYLEFVISKTNYLTVLKEKKIEKFELFYKKQVESYRIKK
ncbi:MAG: tetratricopeptide repeat protein [Bacteroidia bacterium]|nr:tetratricopeptide repeat protein [Bacteroidia bacterium]